MFKSLFCKMLGLFLCLFGIFSDGNGQLTVGETCTKSGFECIFPFTYQGNTYHDCVNVNSEAAGRWCGIVPIVSRFKQGIDYDYCVDSCPKVTAMCTKTGQSCLVPFTYMGRNYTRCAPPTETQKGPWCYVTADGSRSGLCADSCPDKSPSMKPKPKEITTSKSLEELTTQRNSHVFTTTNDSHGDAANLAGSGEEAKIAMMPNATENGTVITPHPGGLLMRDLIIIICVVVAVLGVVAVFVFVKCCRRKSRLSRKEPTEILLTSSNRAYQNA